MRFGRTHFASYLLAPDAGAGAAGGGAAGGAAAGGTAAANAGGAAAGAGADAAAAAAGGAAGGGAAAAAAGGEAKTEPNPTEAFLGAIPEKIRGEVYFKDIKSVEDLATRAFNQAKMLGRDPNTLVPIPDATDAAAWNALYAKLGRPEAADKYVLPKKGEADYSDADKEFQGRLLPILHEAGLTQRQLDLIAPKWNELAVAAATASAALEERGLADATRQLQTEWGAAFKQNMELSDKAISHYADKMKLGDELHNAIKAMPPTSRVALGKLFAGLGSQLSEDGLIGRASGSNGNIIGPNEARQAITGKYADKEFMAAYGNKEAAKHKDAVAEMARLHAVAYPEAVA